MPQVIRRSMGQERGGEMLGQNFTSVGTAALTVLVVMSYTGGH